MSFKPGNLVKFLRFLDRGEGVGIIAKCPTRQECVDYFPAYASRFDSGETFYLILFPVIEKTMICPELWLMPVTEDK